jgi:hypothetical protein
LLVLCSYSAVREFDMKVLRIHSSRRYPRKVRSGPSEQGIRAAIRQAMLNLKLRIEQAQKHEIRILKDQDILGKRAPSCTLLNSMDTLRLLKAFGKKKCGARFKESVSQMFPHLIGAMEHEWGSPIAAHHRAVLEADFGSSDDDHESGDEQRQAQGGDRMEVDGAGRQVPSAPTRVLPSSRATREALAKAAAVDVEDTDAMVLEETDFSRDRARAIAARRRMMQQHQHSLGRVTPSPSNSAAPSPMASPAPGASSETATPAVTPGARARSLHASVAGSPAPVIISSFDADASDSAGSDAEPEEPATPPLSDNEAEFWHSTQNPRFVEKQSYVPRFRAPANVSLANSGQVSQAQSEFTRKLLLQRQQMEEQLQQIQAKRQAELLQQAQQDQQAHQQHLLRQMQQQQVQLMLRQQAASASQPTSPLQELHMAQRQSMLQVMTPNGPMFVPHTAHGLVQPTPLAANTPAALLLSRSPSPAVSPVPSISSPTASVAQLSSSMDALSTVARQEHATQESMEVEAMSTRQRRVRHPTARALELSAYEAEAAQDNAARDFPSDDEYVEDNIVANHAAARKQQRRARRAADRAASRQTAGAQTAPAVVTSQKRVHPSLEASASAEPTSASKKARLETSEQMEAPAFVVQVEATEAPYPMHSLPAGVVQAIPVRSPSPALMAHLVPEPASRGAPLVATVLLASPPSSRPPSATPSRLPLQAPVPLATVAIVPTSVDSNSELAAFSSAPDLVALDTPPRQDSVSPTSGLNSGASSAQNDSPREFTGTHHRTDSFETNESDPMWVEQEATMQVKQPPHSRSTSQTSEAAATSAVTAVSDLPTPVPSPVDVAAATAKARQLADQQLLAWRAAGGPLSPQAQLVAHMHHAEMQRQHQMQMQWAMRQQHIMQQQAALQQQQQQQQQLQQPQQS